MSFWKRYRRAFYVVLLLAVPFYLLRLSSKDPGRLDPVDRAVLQAVAHNQWFETNIVRGIADVADRYVFLINVRRDNEQLRAERARDRTEAERNRAAYEEARRLRRLLHLQEESPTESYAAEVVALDTSPFFRVTRLAITAPDNSRARVGMPVITPDGLVGQINNITGRFANVTLVVDARSNVDAMVERTGARGILHGTGERNRYAAQIEYLQRTDDVRVGDVVVTSGLGCRYPAGLLLGRVSAVTRRDFGLYQEVEIAPAVDFSRLHEVLVLATPPIECHPGAPAPTPRRGARASASGGTS